MGAYDDLIPGSARRQSAYADLLPARTPAPNAPPAEASPAVASAPTPGTGGSPMPQPLSLMQRLAIAAEPYLTPALKTTQAVASGYPDLEAGANAVTGFAFGFPTFVGTAAGTLLARKLGLTEADAADVAGRAAQAVTYQPRTELGKHLAEAVNSPFTLLSEGGQAAGHKVADVTGSPTAAAITDATIQMAPFVLGVARGAPEAFRAAKAKLTPKEAPQRIEPTMPAESKPGFTPPLEPTRQPIEVTPIMKPKAPPAEVPPKPAEPVKPTPYADLMPEGAKPPVAAAAPAVTAPRFQEELVGSSHGQQDLSVTMHIGDKLVGALDYSLYDGVPKINMISVAADQRRKGYGTQLVKELQSKYPDAQIEWGGTTPDGTALRNAIEGSAPKPQPLGVEHPDVQAALQQMVGEAGWAEVGGRLVRQKTGERADEETISRTQWIPKAEWWKGRPGGLNEAQTAEAVRKAIAGEPLKKREQQAISYMAEVANERVAERAKVGNEEWAAATRDVKNEGLDPSHKNVTDADLVARAAQHDEAAVEAAAMKYENDDAAFMAEVRRIVNDHENQAAARRGQANSGPAQEAGTLTSYTEKDLADREAARATAEAQRAAELKAAETKRAADAQRGDFLLTGSDRTADSNPGQRDFLGSPSRGMPAHVVTADTAAGHTPPASGAREVASAKARPDAIRKAITQLFDTVINEKNLSKKNLGIYRIKPETIRVQNRNDLTTIAHEVGHHISNRNKSFRKIMRAHGDELIEAMPEAYKQQERGGRKMTRNFKIEEGFAEFISRWMNDREDAHRVAPQFSKAFETWLDENPKYKAAVDAVSSMIGAHQGLGPADKILAKVGVYKPPLPERVANFASRETFDKFVQAALDKWHPLKLMVQDLSPAVAASKNPYVAARLLPGDAAKIEDWIFSFTSPYDFQKRLDVKNYGKPLHEILHPILKEGPQVTDNFKAYLIAKRARELMNVGKERLFTPQEIRDGLALETSQFKQTAAEIYAYNDRLLDFAVEGGLLSPETAAKFKEYTAYIPFFREPEAHGAGGGGKGAPFKRLHGGTQNLHDPIANIVQNTASIIHATNRNAVLRQSVELATSMPGGGKWIETVRVPMQAQRIATERIIEELNKQGVTVDNTVGNELAAIQTFFQKTGKGDERTRTIVYKSGGELKAAQINDPLLWKAMSNVAPAEMSLIVKILAAPASTLRMGVVLDPTFMVRNYVRDTLTSTLQSQGNFLPILSTARGMKLMAQNADAYKLWRAFGGAYSEYGLEELRGFAENSALVRRMAKRGGFSTESILSPARLYHAYKRLGSYTESGSRIAEFELTYKPGDFDSALQGSLNSRDVSTDFGMRGGDTAIQAWTRIVPFMNPAMQGLYKGARVLSGSDGRRVQIRAATVGASMALASIYLALHNSGEEWYQSLEPWEKATYWHFKLGGEIWRIPKPFEYGMLFASTPEAIALYEAGKENGEEFRQRMIQILDQIAFRVVPQAATIAAEPWANKSFFTGRKIIPDRAQRLEPGMQSGPSTPQIAQVAGAATNTSPAIIDNMVRNTFGTVGVQVEAAADMLLQSTGTFPAARDKTWRQWPAIRAFVHDPENPNSKQIDDFYNALDQYRTSVATLKELRARGNTEKADAYQAAHEQDLRAAHGAEETARRLASLRRRIRAIQWDPNKSPEEKRDEMNLYNQRMKDIAAEQMKLYQPGNRSYSAPGNEGARK